MKVTLHFPKPPICAGILWCWGGLRQAQDHWATLPKASLLKNAEVAYNHKTFLPLISRIKTLAGLPALAPEQTSVINDASGQWLEYLFQNKKLQGPLTNEEVAQGRNPWIQIPWGQARLSSQSHPCPSDLLGSGTQRRKPGPGDMRCKGRWANTVGSMSRALTSAAEVNNFFPCFYTEGLEDRWAARYPCSGKSTTGACPAGSLGFPGSTAQPPLPRRSALA